MDVVADTNAWYEIGAGIGNPESLKRLGHRLLATPTSFLEIASLIDSRSLDQRRAAAVAVVRHADAVLPDCEFHLACIWGLNPTPLNLDWREAFVAVSQAQTPAQLVQGVSDFQGMVVRHVNLPLAKAHRQYEWSDFHDRVVDALDEEIPGYKAARASGRCIHAGKQEATRIAAKLRSAGAKQAFLRASYCRALLEVEAPFTPPTARQIQTARPQLQAYIHAYCEYLVGCATLFAPQSNDLGDLDAFVYLQGGRALLTSDRRWDNIARAVCPSRRMAWPG